MTGPVWEQVWAEALDRLGPDATADEAAELLEVIESPAWPVDDPERG